MSQLTATSTRPPFSRSFYIALFTQVLFALGVTILLPVIALYITDELSAEEHWIGTATVFVTIMAISTRIPAGRLSDQHGRRLIMLIGAGASVAAGVLYIFSSHLAIFLAARMLTGVALGLFTSANKALVADLAPPQRRGEAMGMSNAAFSIAMVLSPLASEWLKNTVGFQSVYVASTLLSVSCLLVTFTLPHVKPTVVENGKLHQSIRVAFRERGTWAANSMMLGLGAVMSVIFTFYPLLAERKALFEDSPRLFASIAMGLGLSIWALTDTLVEPVAGTISDHIGRQRVAIPGLIVTAIGLLMLSRAQNTVNTYIAVAILATGWGTARAISDSIAQDVVAPALRGISAAVLYTSFDLSVGLGAQLLGSGIDGTDFSAFFLIAAAFLIAGCVPGLVLASRLEPYEQRVAAQITGD